MNQAATFTSSYGSLLRHDILHGHSNQVSLHVLVLCQRSYWEAEERQSLLLITLPMFTYPFCRSWVGVPIWPFLFNFINWSLLTFPKMSICPGRSQALPCHSRVCSCPGWPPALARLDSLHLPSPLTHLSPSQSLGGDPPQ